MYNRPAVGKCPAQRRDAGLPLSPAGPRELDQGRPKPQRRGLEGAPLPLLCTPAGRGLADTPVPIPSTRKCTFQHRRFSSALPDLPPVFNSRIQRWWSSGAGADSPLLHLPGVWPQSSAALVPPFQSSLYTKSRNHLCIENKSVCFVRSVREARSRSRGAGVHHDEGR